MTVYTIQIDYKAYIQGLDPDDQKKFWVHSDLLAPNADYAKLYKLPDDSDDARCILFPFTEAEFLDACFAKRIGILGGLTKYKPVNRTGIPIACKMQVSLDGTGTVKPVDSIYDGSTFAIAIPDTMMGSRVVYEATTQIPNQAGRERNARPVTRNSFEFDTVERFVFPLAFSGTDETLDHAKIVELAGSKPPTTPTTGISQQDREAIAKLVEKDIKADPTKYGITPVNTGDITKSITAALEAAIKADPSGFGIPAPVNTDDVIKAVTKAVEADIKADPSDFGITKTTVDPAAIAKTVAATVEQSIKDDPAKFGLTPPDDGKIAEKVTAAIEAAIQADPAKYGIKTVNTDDITKAVTTAVEQDIQANPAKYGITSKGPSPSAIADAVDKYMAAHPVTVSPDLIRGDVETYIKAHPVTVSDATVSGAVAKYMAAHPLPTQAAIATAVEKAIQADPTKYGITPGKPGPGPTPDQISGAIATYIKDHPLPTAESITTAVEQDIQANPSKYGIGNVPPDAIATAVKAYIADNPISVDPQQITDDVNTYMQAHPVTVPDEKINGAVNTYMDAHPVPTEASITDAVEQAIKADPTAYGITPGKPGPGPSPEQISGAIAAYMDAHPVPTREQVAEVVEKAIKANPTAYGLTPGKPGPGPTTEAIAGAIATYMKAHPVPTTADVANNVEDAIKADPGAYGITAGADDDKGKINGALVMSYLVKDGLNFIDANSQYFDVSGGEPVNLREAFGPVLVAAKTEALENPDTWGLPTDKRSPTPVNYSTLGDKFSSYVIDHLPSGIALGKDTGTPNYPVRGGLQDLVADSSTVYYEIYGRAKLAHHFYNQSFTRLVTYSVASLIKYNPDQYFGTAKTSTPTPRVPMQLINFAGQGQKVLDLMGQRGIKPANTDIGEYLVSNNIQLFCFSRDGETGQQIDYLEANKDLDNAVLDGEDWITDLPINTELNVTGSMLHLGKVKQGAKPDDDYYVFTQGQSPLDDFDTQYSYKSTIKANQTKTFRLVGNLSYSSCCLDFNSDAQTGDTYYINFLVASRVPKSTTINDSFASIVQRGKVPIGKEQYFENWAIALSHDTGPRELVADEIIYFDKFFDVQNTSDSDVEQCLSMFVQVYSLGTDQASSRALKLIAIRNFELNIFEV